MRWCWALGRSTSALLNSGMTPTAEATVDVVEPLGAQTLVYLRAGPMPLSMLVDGHIELVPGEVVQLTISQDSIHLFHPHTGSAILTQTSEEAVK